MGVEVELEGEHVPHGRPARKGGGRYATAAFGGWMSVPAQYMADVAPCAMVDPARPRPSVDRRKT